MPSPGSLPIDLLEFFRTGLLGGVRLGQTKEHIARDFPDPDDWGPVGRATCAGDALIWRYGDIELNFVCDRLCMIFSGGVRGFRGGPSLAVDRWILEDADRTSLPIMREALGREQVVFRETSRVGPEGGSEVTLTLPSGVALRFGAPDDREVEVGARPRDQDTMVLTSFVLRE